MARFPLMTVFVVLLAANALASPAGPFMNALRAEQNLVHRSDFAGGWPLAASTCASDSVTCDNLNNIVNPACCPSGTTCKGLNVDPYCCPTNDDCATEVHNFPVCAGSGQTMYYLRGSLTDFFCCKEGQIGTTPISGYTGICRDADSPPPSSLLATKAAQYGATAVGSNPTASNKAATKTGASGSAATGSNGSGTGTAGASGATSTTIINNNGGSSSSSSSSSSSASASSSSLSTGAIAGIAIGAAALIGLILAIGWFYRSGRFHRGQAAPLAPVQETKYGGPQNMYGPPTASSLPTSPDYEGPQEWKSPDVRSQYTDSTAVVSGPPTMPPAANRSELGS